MKVHVIVDFMHIYYRYMYMLRSGRMSRLTADIQVGNELVKADVSNMYYVLKEIESARKKYEDQGHDVTVSICFDTKSDRKGEDADYKANRVNKLTADNIDEIALTRNTLNEAGYNIYIQEGYEADDLVSSLVDKYKNDFDYSIIYTNDVDLFVNVCDKVGIMRYKVKKGYGAVDNSNFEEYLSDELKCCMPYNCVLLFKSLCGDTSDGVKGVKGFGPKAFDKYVNNLKLNNVSFDNMCDANYVEEVLRNNNTFKDGELEQALNSLALVKFRGVEVEFPLSKSSTEKRENAYGKYQMKSLI